MTVLVDSHEPTDWFHEHMSLADTRIDGNIEPLETVLPEDRVHNYSTTFDTWLSASGRSAPRPSSPWNIVLVSPPHPEPWRTFSNNLITKKSSARRKLDADTLIHEGNMIFIIHHDSLRTGGVVRETISPSGYFPNVPVQHSKESCTETLEKYNYARTYCIVSMTSSLIISYMICSIFHCRVV